MISDLKSISRNRAVLSTRMRPPFIWSINIMKKTNIALFIVAGLLALWNLTQGQTISQDTTWFRNGTVSAVTTYVDGHRVERCVFYPTSEIWMIAEYDPVTGLQENDEFWYWRNGEVQHACSYVNGYCHGAAYWWDEFGNWTKTELYVESRRVSVEDYHKYFPRDDYEEEPEPSAFALRAKGL